MFLLLKTFRWWGEQTVLSEPLGEGGMASWPPPDPPMGIVHYGA